jgi:hypothetical protein
MLALADWIERTGSMPISVNDDENRVRSYLLKLVSEEELDQIEEHFLATSDHSELIGDAEHRLISDYVQDRLSDEQRRAFERNYLVTSERREQLAIAQSLRGMEDTVPHAAKAHRLPGAARPNLWRRFLDWVAAPGLMVGFATAAMTVALLSGNVVLFLRWRDQAHQTEMASQQIRTLQSSKESARPAIATARVFGIPVLKVEQTSLSVGERQKLTFRLPPDVLGTIAIPLEIPATTDGATVDVALSFSGRSIWSEGAIHLRGAGKVQQADLLIPFSAIRPHLGQPLNLEIVERGHAELGTFQLIFEVAK